MQKPTGSKKHFTMRHRNFIEASITLGRSIQEMAAAMNFSRQSVYDELWANSYTKGSKGGPRFITVEDLLPMCLRLTKYPFVCNVCKHKQGCRNLKRYYHAEVAQFQAEERLKARRQGTRLTKGEILAIEEFLAPGIKKGQSIHHVYKSNPGVFPITERTIRNMINRKELSVRNIDLPYTVRYKVKKQYVPKKPLASRMPELLFGRMYDDFLDTVPYRQHHAQLDSVIGKINDHTTILTIFFPKLSFMFGYVCRPKGWLSVNNHLLRLRATLGHDLWKKAFPYILCDRGSEFDRLYLLEHDLINGDYVPLSKVFYADAYTSNQRAAIESNHRLIRRIIPKSRTLNNLRQEDLDLIFSHINGLIRKSQANKTGYELVKAELGEEFLNAVNISYIAPRDIILKPELLSIKR